MKLPNLQEYSQDIRRFLSHPLQLVGGWLRDFTFRRLVQNSGWLLGGNAVAALLGIVGTAIKTRALGVQQFGLFAVIVAYVALIQQLASFQSWQALIKYGAEALNHQRADRLFMGQIKLSLVLDVVGALTGVVVAIAGAYLLAELRVWTLSTSHMVAVYSLSILSILSSTPTGILRLLDRFELVSAQIVVTSLLAVAGAVVVYLEGFGILGFLIVMAGSSILGTVLALIMALTVMHKRNGLRFWRAPIREWRPAVQFSLWTYVTSTLDIPVQQLDILIVSAVVSLEGAGIYKIIKQVVSLLSMLADPIYQAVYPQFATMIAAHNRVAAVKYAAKIGSLLFAMLGPVAVLVGSTSFWWLGAVFGQDFAAGATALCFFLVFKAFAIGFVTIHPLFTAMGYVKQTTFILFLADILYLGLAWQLGRTMGLVGVALAYGVQFSTVVGLKALHIHQRGMEPSDLV